MNIVCRFSVTNNSSMALAQIEFCGQSYKHFTLVNYESRVVIWGIFQSGTTLESSLTSVKCL